MKPVKLPISKLEAEKSCHVGFDVLTKNELHTDEILHASENCPTYMQCLNCRRGREFNSELFLRVLCWKIAYTVTHTVAPPPRDSPKVSTPCYVGAIQIRHQ
jgi:hypothetical protein